MAHLAQRPEASPDAMTTAGAAATQLYTPLAFPYFARANDLPAPLPTVQEILASDDMFPCIFQHRAIRRVGPHFIVKHGAAVKLDEAANMHFVATHSAAAVRMPKLYAAFHDAASATNFIVMEHVRGASLADAWDGLGERGRARVAAALAPMLRALRAIPQATGSGCASSSYYGRLGARPFDDIFFLGATGATGGAGAGAGPFATETALNAALYARYRARHPHLAAGRAEFYRDVVFPAVLRGHAPVFTHGDLQAKNIIVVDDDDGDDDGDEARRGAARCCLIDWECAAWYPSYWEYANALWTSRRWGDDWFRFVGAALGGGEQFVVEFLGVENLLGDLLDAPQPGV